MTILEKIADAVQDKTPRPNFRQLIAGRIFADYPESTPDQSDEKKIVNLEREWINSHAPTAGANGYPEKRARLRYQQELKDRAEHARKGVIDTTAVRSLASLMEEEKAKMETCKKAYKQVSQEAGEVAGAIIDRFLTFADLWLTAREHTEKNECESLALPWIPSSIVTATRAMIGELRAKRETITHGAGRPSELCPLFLFPKIKQ